MSTPQRQRPALADDRLAAYARLLDPAPVAMVVLAATGLTAAAAQAWPPRERLLPFLISLLCSQFAIALHNHYCDRDLDARARPWRALPRGLISPRTALGASLVLLAGGLLAALPLGVDVLALVALGTGAGFAYSAGPKRTLWSWAPYWVALPTLAVCAFVVAGRVEPQLWLAYVIGAPLVVAVHLVDALADLEADAALGVRGLAQRLGRQRALLACWGALALAQVLALELWPGGRGPHWTFFLSCGLLGLGVLAWRGGSWRGHWLAVMSAAVVLGVGWVGDLAGGWR